MANIFSSRYLNVEVFVIRVKKRQEGGMYLETDGQTGRWTDSQMDRQMDGWMDGWMDGQTDRYIWMSTGLQIKNTS